MKVTEKFSILFLLEKSKKTTDGRYPIAVRLTVNCRRAEFFMKRKLAPEQWNQETNRAIGKTDEIIAINNEIDRIKAQLIQHFEKLALVTDNITASMMKLSYLGKPLDKEFNEKTLLFGVDFVMAKLNEKVKKKIRSQGTLIRWNIFRRKLVAFLSSQYGKKDIFLKDVRFSFAEDFLDYLMLKDPKNIGSNAAMKYVKYVKQVMKKCTERGWLTRSPIEDFKCTYDQPEREYLTMEEIMEIYNKPMINRLQEVRDVYIFCCFTGFAYSDVYGLTPGHIYCGLGGKKWISTNRVKTSSREAVPLLPLAEEIIARYRNHPHCQMRGCLLPVDSNQRYNAYLKEIADLCGIGKNLTTHMARHTFATTVTLENDVPIETVSKMLGHKSIRTTQIYARVTQKKVSNNMRDLEEKIFSNNGTLKTSFEPKQK